MTWDDFFQALCVGAEARRGSADAPTVRRLYNLLAVAHERGWKARCETRLTVHRVVFQIQRQQSGGETLCGPWEADEQAALASAAEMLALRL